MLYETVRDLPIRMSNHLLPLLQVRAQIPYMGRFHSDWATAEIARKYCAHLRSEARKNGELPADPRYGYLKTNSAKRHPNARRGTRPGLAKGQDHDNASDDERQDPSSSPGAGPSSLPNINSVADEEMMDGPGWFGSVPPSDNEDGSDLDDDLDFGGDK